jgi:hypothetical protein
MDHEPTIEHDAQCIRCGYQADTTSDGLCSVQYGQPGDPSCWSRYLSDTRDDERTVAEWIAKPGRAA